MKNQIEIASEVNNSSNAGKLASVVRENKRRIAMFVVAAMIVSAAAVSCSKDPKNNGDGSGDKITVTVENASDYGDVKTVKLYVVQNYVDDSKDAVIASGDFKNDGFTLNRPATIASKYLSSFSAMLGEYSTVTVSNKNAKFADNLYILGYNSSDNMPIAQFGCFKKEGNIQYVKVWWYVDSDVTLSGAAEYIRGNQYNESWITIYDYSLSLIEGWNDIYVTRTETTVLDEKTVKYEFKNSQISGLKWFGYGLDDFSVVDW